MPRRARPCSSPGVFAPVIRATAVLPPSRFFSTRCNRTKPAGSTVRTHLVGRDRRGSVSRLVRPPWLTSVFFLPNGPVRPRPVTRTCQTSLIIQRYALLGCLTKVGKLLRKANKCSCESQGDGRAIWIRRGPCGNARFAVPARSTVAGYNRAGPPPCMRWRGPCQATLRQVSQLPGLPDFTGRPLVPHTRGSYRFPDPRHVPEVAPGSGVRSER
jgi:hypothetical protein